MAGRFPVLTDACVNEHLAEALRDRGWDVARSIDLHPGRAKDEVLFERAGADDRVFVTNDRPAEAIARLLIAALVTSLGLGAYGPSFGGPRLRFSRLPLNSSRRQITR